jgi:hypothetical protein
MKRTSIICYSFFLFAALIISCSHMKPLQSVNLYFDAFHSPSVSFAIDFDSSILVCKNYGYEPKLDSVTKQLITVFEKRYKLSSLSTSKLQQLFSKYAPDTSLYHYEEAMDGGGFMIEYVRSKGDTAKLTAINISRSKYTSDYIQLDSFFQEAYMVVKDSMGINTLDETYESYYSEMPIRKVSEEPLTYKIWGNFTGCREDNKELTDFLNGLAKEKCSIIEVGYRKLSYCLTEVIADYSLKGNIHFVSDEDDLPWIWDELNELKAQVLEAKKHNKVLEETSSNGVFLSVYLHDSAVLNRWLETPRKELFKSKEELGQICK